MSTEVLVESKDIPYLFKFTAEAWKQFRTLSGAYAAKSGRISLRGRIKGKVLKSID